jgi:hypothetical protein
MKSCCDSRRWGVVLLGVVVAWFVCASAWNTTARADDWFDLNGKALAKFDFDGTTLPTSVDGLKLKYPAAKLEPERAEQSVGLECYAVDDLPNVDVARFYFCDGHLYQFEAQYSLARIEKLGGMRFVLQRLIDTWGPVDHAGESRWTWNRPMYSRRADFYALPETAHLAITDTGWMPTVNKRMSQAEAKQPMNLGF